MTVGPIGGGAAAGTPVGGGQVIHAGGGAPIWLHLLRLQTDTHTYEVECMNRPCMLGNKQINLGDSVTFRTDNKWCYMAPGPNAPKRK